jgi:hypothetical protein
MSESPSHLTIDLPLVPLWVFCGKLRLQGLPGRPPEGKSDGDPLCPGFFAGESQPWPHQPLQSAARPDAYGQLKHANSHKRHKMHFCAFCAIYRVLAAEFYPKLRAVTGGRIRAIFQASNSNLGNEESGLLRACLEKQDPVLADRIMVGKTGCCFGKQDHGWKNTTLFWKTGSSP